MEPANNSEIVFVVIVCCFMFVLFYMLHSGTRTPVAVALRFGIALKRPA